MIAVDGGDFIARQDRTPEKGSLQLAIAAEFMLDAMRAMGYAAAAVGEGDLVLGDGFLAGQAQRAGVPLLSASVHVNGDVLFPPAMVIDIAGLRVGIAAMLWDGFAHYVAQHSDPGRPMSLLPSEAALRAGLDALEDRADVRILLAHAPLTELRALLAGCPGYDVVVSGHDTDRHVITTPELIGGAHLVQAGWDGERVGRLDFTVDRQGRIIAAAGVAVPMNALWPDHPSMTALHDAYLARVAQAIEEILADYPVSPPPTGGSYVGTANCRTCHPTEWSSWRTTKHALAWKTLADRNRDFDPECFACHTTGFQYEGGFRLITETPAMAAVGCESCHGAGADHTAEPRAPYSRPDKTSCTQCHVPLHSPDFDYETYLPQVLHPAPP